MNRPPRARPGGGREIRHIYLAELRGALRERNVLINTILLPLLLYPVLLWLTLNGILFVRGQAERLTTRVAVSGLPAEHEGLLERIGSERIELETLGPSTTDTVERRIRDGELDAALLFEPRPEPAGDFLAVVIESSARDASSTAAARLLTAAHDHRDDWLWGKAQRFVDRADWDGFVVERDNLATPVQMGAMILGLLAPLYFVIMVAMGCLYPAVDSTAGERERGTWETTLTMAAPRLSIVIAKYLYVTTLGFTAGLLNLLGMSLSFGSVLAPLLAGSGEEIGLRVPWPTVPWLLLGALLLAGSIAAAMMIFAVFARSFREGQAMVTPVYLLSFLPVLFLAREGLELTPGLASIPVVNVALLVRTALRGTLPLAGTVITFAVQLGLIAALLLVASRIIRHEDVVTGSFSGGPIAFLRRRLGRAGVPSAEVSP